MTYSSVTFGLNGMPVNDSLENHVRPVNVARDGQPLAAIRVNTGGLSTYSQATGATVQSTTERAQLIDHGRSTIVGGMRTSVEADETLRKQAPHLAQSGTQALDAGELAGATEMADREEAEWETIPNEIGRQVVGELRGAGQGLTTPLTLAMMAGDAQKTEVITQRISEALGEDVSLTRGKIQISMDALAPQTQRFVESHGVSFADFSAWGQQNHRDTIASVMVRHVNGGKVADCWGPIVKSFASRGGSKA